MKKNIDLSIVLPIHNQEIIITPVVASIAKVLKPLPITYELVLVENGSIDHTLTTLQQLEKKYPQVKTIIAPKGYGSAVIAGLKQTKGTYVSYMPSDGQLSTGLLLQLFKIITRNDFDLVKIRRVTRESWIRTIRSKIFNILTRCLHPIPDTIQDINGSPRIFKRVWLKKLNLRYTDSFIDTEMAVKAHLLKWNIKEIPAPTLPRLGGKSTVNYKTIIEFLQNLATFRQRPAFKMWLQETMSRPKISS